MLCLRPLLVTAALITLGSSPALAQTDTGTVAFPEDGAPLNRADMPEGGVSPDWPGKTEEERKAAEEQKKKAPPKKTAGQREGRPGVVAPHLASAQKDYSGETLEGLTVRFDGFIRLIGDFIENDERDFIGNNNGFRLGTARLGTFARYEDLVFAYISLEGAFAANQGANDANAELTVQLRDAFFGSKPFQWLEIWGGRFRPPYDISSLESTRERTFIDTPLATRGVRRTQGIEAAGLTPGRQTGIMVHAERVGLTDDGFDFGYALAFTNGRTFERELNDNNKFGFFGRLSAHYGSWISLNGAMFYDERTTGDLPDLFDENVLGYEGSLLAQAFGFSVEGQVLFQSTSFPTSGQADANALGFHVQGAYARWGFELAYRYGWYDPLMDDGAAQIPDQVAEHTLGLSYFANPLPLRFSINGTLAEEELNVNNSRLTLLAQFKF